MGQLNVHGVGTDEPIVWYEGSGTNDRRFLMKDHQGSVIAISNSTGDIIDKNSYSVYGQPDSQNIGRFGYTGQMWIEEAGLYHYKARAYDPSLRRFLQTDPIGYAAGMNIYAYVGGDPINFTDPSGMTRCWRETYWETRNRTTGEFAGERGVTATPVSCPPQERSGGFGFGASGSPDGGYNPGFAGSGGGGGGGSGVIKAAPHKETPVCDHLGQLVNTELFSKAIFGMNLIRNFKGIGGIFEGTYMLEFSGDAAFGPATGLALGGVYIRANLSDYGYYGNVSFGGGVDLDFGVAALYTTASSIEGFGTMGEIGLTVFDGYLGAVYDQNGDIHPVVGAGVSLGIPLSGSIQNSETGTYSCAK